MRIEYDINRLQSVLTDFYHITKLKISILDTKFQTIASVENPQLCFCSTIQSFDNCEGCMKSDALLLKECSESRQIAIRVCHAGLTNAALPVLLSNEIIGFVIMGQVRETEDFDSIKHLLPPHSDYTKLIEGYQMLTHYNRSQLESAARTVAMLTISILTENMIKLEAEELAERATSYIKENLCQDLSIETLCKKMNTSKNLLYKSFKSKHDCTVNDYITNCRIDSAKKLLYSGSLSIREISEKIGFDDSAYFCRLFKRHAGCTPLQYRNQIRKKV